MSITTISATVLDSRQDKSLHRVKGQPAKAVTTIKKKKKNLIQMLASCSPSLGQSTKCTNTIQLYKQT